MYVKVANDCSLRRDCYIVQVLIGLSVSSILFFDVINFYMSLFLSRSEISQL